MITVKLMHESAKVSSKIEEILNVCGYVPFIGTFFAIFRSILGKIQFFGGCAIALYAAITTKEHVKRIALNFILHGLLNIGRSFLEFIPFLSLVTCLPYDHYSKKKILKYETS